MLDALRNLAKALVDGDHDGATTTVNLLAGQGANFPDPAVSGQYNLTWFDLTAFPDPSDDPNVEIVRVTARAGDVLTVLRGQDSSVASTKNTAGHQYLLILAPGAKMFGDINAELAVGIFPYATTGGVADAYTLTLPVTISSYVAGLRLRVKINASNTGASTINVNSLGVKSIIKRGGLALEAGDLVSGAVVEMVYDGTNFMLLANSVAAAPGTALMTLLDNATATILAVINTPVKIAGTYGASDLKNFSHSAGTLTYTGPSASKFLASLSVSVNSASANKQLTIYFTKNGAIVSTYKGQEFFATAIDAHSVSIAAFLSLSPSDTVEAWIENNSGATNATVTQLQFMLREVK